MDSSAPKVSHDACLPESLLKNLDGRMMYHVYLEGSGPLPWPRIELIKQTAGNRERGRVLQPEDAVTLRTMLKQNVDCTADGTVMERGYISFLRYYGIYDCNPKLLKVITEIYDRARPFVDKLKEPGSMWTTTDGYCYREDPTTKINVTEAADPRAGGGAGGGAAVGQGSQGGSRRRRRPSRKYKKSKRVLRRKSRSTRRR